MEINTTKVVDNEVVKADDFDYGFKSFISNFALGMRLLMNNESSFVIGGKVKKSNAGGMNLAIDPVYSYCKDSVIDIYQVVIKDEITDLVNINTADSQDRIDIVEICGILEDYDEQQRAINDSETGLKTYPVITTKQRIKLVANVKKGTPGDIVAPETTDGWVKLAEIKVRANSLSIDETDIFNITSDYTNVDNIGWTNEKNITINIGALNDLNKRYRVEHNQDGTHKNAVIHSANVDFGTNTNQVNGSKMPIGGTSTVLGSVTIPSSSKLNEVLGLIAVQFNTLYKSYLKIGAFKFNGEVQIGSILSEDETSIEKPLIIGSAGDGSAYLKIDDNQVFSITADKKLRMAPGYTPSNEMDVVTKKTTDELGQRVTQTESRVSDLESSVTNTKEYSNAALSRYVYKGYVKVATTENISLAGVQTIDGVSLAIGDTVLVKDQEDKKDNGIWEVQSGFWNRVADYSEGNESNLLFKLFYATVGTQAGKFYYLPNDSITIGTSELDFVEGTFSSANIGGKIVIRDKDGNFSANNITANLCGLATCASYGNGGTFCTDRINSLAGNGLLTEDGSVGWTGITSKAWGLGAIDRPGYIRTSGNNLLHYRADTNASYTIWDTGNLTPGNYLAKSGGTMTGKITMPSNCYASAGGALNMNNSDITGANAIRFDDSSEPGEGLIFKEGTSCYGFRVCSGCAYIDTIGSSPKDGMYGGFVGWSKAVWYNAVGKGSGDVRFTGACTICNGFSKPVLVFKGQNGLNCMATVLGNSSVAISAFNCNCPTYYFRII